MDQYALLTLVGEDRPGIVSRVSQTLYETGCNIEDSSMTRLRGEFTIMLILKLPEETTLSDLDLKLSPVAASLELTHLLKGLRSELAIRQGSGPGEPFMVNLLGSDKPGIVFRVSRFLAEMGVNITDLRTQVVGSARRPVYIMNIEAEWEGPLPTVEEGMARLAAELGVEITVRSLSADPM